MFLSQVVEPRQRGQAAGSDGPVCGRADGPGVPRRVQAAVRADGGVPGVSPELALQGDPGEHSEHGQQLKPRDPRRTRRTLGSPLNSTQVLRLPSEEPRTVVETLPVNLCVCDHFHPSSSSANRKHATYFSLCDTHFSWHIIGYLFCFVWKIMAKEIKKCLTL